MKADVVEVRQLTTDDWALWKAVRLEALQLHPEAFSASYEDEVQYTPDAYKQRLEQNAIFGAFVDNALVGIAGFLVLASRKTRHRGNLFSMYLKKEYRGRGIADRLVDAVIDHAKTKVLQLHCSVVTENISAIKLYQNKGFKIYGTEPRSLKIDDRYYDEHFMVLTFDVSVG